jgi:bacteriorhodopsin
MLNFNPSIVAVADGGLGIEQVTQYLFWVVTVAMAAATAFLWLQRAEVAPRFRGTLVVSGLITGIAAFHYYRMASIYGGGTFPTEYRYIDWIITTPLMLIKFPMLLGMGKKANKWLGQLVGLDLIMIITAYVAEASPLASGMWWGFFIIACLAEAAIVWILFRSMNDSIGAVPAPLSLALRRMRAFILIGWLIYPIGFLLALAGPAGQDIRELAYNVADVINKVGFGLVVYLGVKQMSEPERGSSQPEAIPNPS